MQRFNMGKISMTRALNNTMADNTLFAKESTAALQKYTSCDWGDISAGDKQLNDEAIASGQDRIFAAYQTSEGKIYIITEWDRSYTTLMFANEY